MIVWIAETGCYSDHATFGAYDSAERAMAALPGNKWTRTVWLNTMNKPPTHWSTWENDLDWDEHASVTPYEVVATGNLRKVDEVLEQRPDPANPKGNWLYKQISTAEANALEHGKTSYA